ncbi:MAG: sigma-54-dependent Fis family transcriptional regulator [Desulfovibrio sp.]|nr:sigma-54-dependent Fis family transcriptional regulator [Desulfovibrio sp.]
MNDAPEKESILTKLIGLCDDLAWGRPTDEAALYELTQQGASTPELERLAEAFGLMSVKVEAREYQRTLLIEELEERNRQLEEIRTQLEGQQAQLVENLRREYNVRRVIGQCAAMKRVVTQALAIARHPVNTLILGPTGTGKEVIAKTIHYHSARRKAPFVAVNCSAIPDTLFESEMFGIEKGVATGVSSRRGLVEEASGGTLFLDELGELPLTHQAKLLRVLEESEVVRVGSSRPIAVDIKVIAATNADLEQAIKEKRFREDLYWRINVAELRLPPLNERGDDILLLARHLLAQHSRSLGRSVLKLAPATRQCLLSYDWPGNVRELSNEMERAAALALENIIRPSDLSHRLLSALGRSGSIGTQEDPPSPSPLDPAPDYNLEKTEQRLIQQALAKSNGNKSRAAELLGITREGLRKKLLRHGLRDDQAGDRA